MRKALFVLGMFLVPLAVTALYGFLVWWLVPSDGRGLFGDMFAGFISGLAFIAFVFALKQNSMQLQQQAELLDVQRRDLEQQGELLSQQTRCIMFGGMLTVLTSGRLGSLKQRTSDLGMKTPGSDAVIHKWFSIFMDDAERLAEGRVKPK